MKIIKEEVQRTLNGGSGSNGQVINIDNSSLGPVIIIQIQNVINLVNNININFGNIFSKFNKFNHAWR